MSDLILVDTNERSTNPSFYEDLLTEFGPEHVRVANLDYDLVIPLTSGLLSIERKKVNDLLGSIADGRIFRQVEAMCEASHWSFVLIHGSLHYASDEDFVIADGRLTKWRGKSVRAAIRTIQMAGCNVEYVPPNGSCVRTIREILETVSKPSHLHMERKRAITFRDVTMTDAQREEYKQVEFIASLPGIGRKRAEALMSYLANGSQRKWGTVARALTLISQMGKTQPLVKELSEHWGKLTVQRIQSFLGFDDHHYLMMLDKRMNVPVKLAKPKVSKKRK